MQTPQYRVSLLSMRSRTEPATTAPGVVRVLPYAVLGMRIGRQVRRHEIDSDTRRNIDAARAHLAVAVSSLVSSGLEDSEALAKGLALGLAYDPALFTKVMAEIAAEAQRAQSPALAHAFRAATRAFQHARLARADVQAAAGAVDELCAALSDLADLEPLEASVAPRSARAEAFTVQPTVTRLVQTVTPTNGPNGATEALHALGSAVLAA